MSLSDDILNVPEAPAGEQKVCLSCGLCCDGTLFTNARLRPGERGEIGGLPELIKASSFRAGDEELFRLPCGYFSGRCTIYDRKKAWVCSAFRCRVLKDFAGGVISLEEALETVRDAVRMRDELAEMFSTVSGSAGRVHFRKMLSLIGKLPVRGGAVSGDDAEVLIVRCNIFAALLIKQFRTDEDFEKLVMK